MTATSWIGRARIWREARGPSRCRCCSRCLRAAACRSSPSCPTAGRPVSSRQVLARAASAPRQSRPSSPVRAPARSRPAEEENRKSNPRARLGNVWNRSKQESLLPTYRQNVYGSLVYGLWCTTNPFLEFPQPPSVKSLVYLPVFLKLIFYTIASNLSFLSHMAIPMQSCISIFQSISARL